MSYMFWDSPLITNVDALATNKDGNHPNNWNTSNVTNMAYMFAASGGDDPVMALADISGLANWDTAKVKNMEHMFFKTSITNVDALATNKDGNHPNNWNTANVTNMDAMFRHDASLVNISGLANWDTSKVTSMVSMFNGDTSLTSISPVKGWNVSSVTATAGSTSSSTNKFYLMFSGVPSSVTSGFYFTNRQGIINSSGTYVPSS